ncbi:MAG: large subunit ribosomal protein L10 [Rickettsiales bacterium]|jgi:large subunit ribosomal protein L10
MNRIEKTNLVASMRESLMKSNIVLLLHYRGLSDKQLYDFRVELKSKGVNLKIIKNTLAKVAIKDSELEILSEYLSGPTAICYSDDVVSLTKIAVETSKLNKDLKIQVGYLNKSILSKDAIDSLSKLGSLEEVRSSFLSVLQGSQSKFVRVLNAPASAIVAVISNYADSKQ